MKVLQKYLIAFVSLTFVLSFSVSGQTQVPIKDGSLGAKQWGSCIKVTWISESENGINHYEVYRSTVKDGSFTDCVKDNIAPQGDNHSYSIDDNCELFKTESSMYYYKIKGVYSDDSGIFSDAVGTVYSSTSSTAKRTWGSIKAMFR
jgi:hypothetical protein